MTETAPRSPQMSYHTDRWLPVWLREKLATPVRAGAGAHQWIFTCTKALKNFMPADEILPLMLAAGSGIDRDITREVQEALRYARCADDDYAPDERMAEAAIHPVFPKASAEVLSRIQRADLREAARISPVRLPDAETAIDCLFPGDPLLCLGTAPWSCAVRSRSEWRGRISNHPFIVPSEMTAKTALNMNGKESARCYGNTGPKIYQVVEFDEKVSDGSFEHQLGRIYRLSEILPVAMILHSGGKSLHAWFPVWELTQKEQLDFFSAACILGADPATWVRCQLVRVPGGRRDSDTVQICFYLDPDACLSASAQNTQHAGI